MWLKDLGTRLSARIHSMWQCSNMLITDVLYMQMSSMTKLVRVLHSVAWLNHKIVFPVLCAQHVCVKSYSTGAILCFTTIILLCVQVASPTLVQLPLTMLCGWWLTQTGVPSISILERYVSVYYSLQNYSPRNTESWVSLHSNDYLIPTM